MGYIEKIMGDNERLIYRTHQHLLIFFIETSSLVLAFLFFLTLGVAFFLSPDREPASTARFVIWLIALCSLVVPLFLIAREWRRDRIHRHSEGELRNVADAQARARKERERRRNVLKTIILSALALVVILVLALLLQFKPDLDSVGWIAIGISLIPLAMFAYEFLEWLNRRYIISNRRVVKVSGIVGKHVYDYALEKVNDLKLDQTFWGRLFRWGKIEILTAADLDALEMEYDDTADLRDAYSDRYIWDISNPVRFKKLLLNAKEELQMGVPAVARMEGVSAAPTPSDEEQTEAQITPTASANIPDLIEELDQLRKKGLLTDREFRAKKKELLDRM